jgi:hypothetical protein
MSNPILIKHPLTEQWIDIDPSQEWFWTKKWQLEEREVDRELEAGRYEKFNNIDDFIESL